MGKIRGSHSSPGIYTEITDLSYAANSLGITTAALVGETLKGPAFEPVFISNAAEFETYFGGTSPELVPGTNYPKYELPYVAKSYLSASDQLYVCRVLGLSGYDAGKAWIINGIDENDKYYPICVLRSKGSHVTEGGIEDRCNGANDSDRYDQINFEMDDYILRISPSIKNSYVGDCGTEHIEAGTAPTKIGCFDDFNLEVCKLNTQPGTTTGGNTGTATGDTNTEGGDDTAQGGEATGGNTGETTNTENDNTTPAPEYTVIDSYNVSFKSGARNYILKVLGNSPYSEGSTPKVFVESIYEYNLDRCEEINTDVFVSEKENDYKDPFTCAITPWIVSEIKGNDAKRLDVKKLFRFYTLTDGNNANQEVKISIANIRPDEGTFDVYVRAFYDTDSAPVILESYRNVTMVPGTDTYIAYKIGTIDGKYEGKSKYVLLEIIENNMTEECIPCGFLGYPIPGFELEGDKVLEPVEVGYNVMYDDSIKSKKQYFGVSSFVNFDYDVLAYKGSSTRNANYGTNHTPGFHLDSFLNSELNPDVTYSIDGQIVEGLKWNTVHPKNKVANGGMSPFIGSESDMEKTIYSDRNLRKFTVLPYGGFDGWDIYRKKRSCGDEFKATRYVGNLGPDYSISNGVGVESVAMQLTGKTNNSDYYAFLGAVRQFSDPERHIINLLATPGIDYVNNTLLVNDILSMLEDERQDTFYIVTTPDKPEGAEDSVDEMYSASDVVGNFEDTGINTYYAATYYPWVKYHDQEHNRYIYLPPTKDAIRNMANVDNKKFPWYAPAGTERGDVNCTKMRFFAKRDDEDTVYDSCINPLKTFSKDGVKIWGNKTMYLEDTPMNRINVVRLMLYLRKIISESVRSLLFQPLDATLTSDFRSIVEPILSGVKSNRGIADFRLNVSQTPEQMDAHELSAKLWVKPTPTLEYIEIEFVVTPMGVEFVD